MLGVIGHWEHKNWATSPEIIKWLSSFWRYTARSFGVDTLMFVEIDDTVPKIDMDFKHYSHHTSLKEAIKEFPSATYVFVERGLPESIELSKFKHPSGDVIYVFGGDYSKIDLELLDLDSINHHTIHIDTITDVPLWAPIAMGIILSDRCRED